jgi:hypothetical protein
MTHLDTDKASLTSAMASALGKAFAELSLPSVTLGKAFAEYYTGFAECFRHSAKQLIPVVIIYMKGRF